MKLIARAVPDPHSVYFVPASGPRPNWDAYARDTSGITRGANRNHLVHTALESIAYQTREVLEGMACDSGLRLGTSARRVGS